MQAKAPNIWLEDSSQSLTRGTLSPPVQPSWAVWSRSELLGDARGREPFNHVSRTGIVVEDFGCSGGRPSGLGSKDRARHD